MSPIPRRSRPTGRVLSALSTLLPALILAGSLAAQDRPPIVVDDYGPWKRVTSVALSPDGAWMSYAYAPLEGDDTLFVKALDRDDVHAVPRGSSPRFSSDGAWVAYLVAPPEPEGGAR